MNFGYFSIFAILIAISGVRIVVAIYRDRAEIFDDRFTDADRRMVNQAAFFLLLPISVALHELGHAIMVWVFGAEVVDFGFYFFAGFVSYQGYLTDVQQILIAVAGVTVNVIMAGLALGFVFLKRPPMRAAFNELLVQFAIISTANALIFYPLIDFALDMNGDFRQMYFGGVPWLSGIILVCHVGILLGGYLAFRSERVGKRLSALTELPPGVRRGFMGGLRLAPGATMPNQAQPIELTENEKTLQSAVKRIASGWPHRINASLTRRAAGPLLVLRWNQPDGGRAVSIAHEPAGSAAVSILVPAGSSASTMIWQRWSSFPTEDELVLGIRLAMEEADRRPAAISPGVAAVTQ